MNLTNVKNIELLRKGVYAQELAHYAALCNLYATHLKSVAMNPDNITPADLEKASKKYGPLMNAASKSNFDFLTGKTHPRLRDDGTLQSPEYSESDVEFFKLYAYHSEKLLQFRTGSRLLEKVFVTDLQTGKKVPSSEALDEFKEYMSKKVPMERRDNEYSLFKISERYLRKESARRGIPQDKLESQLIEERSSLINENSGNFLVNKLIPEHSPRWLGHKFFMDSNEAINLIESIDPDHLPVSSTIIRKGLTPAHFGAEITGVKGNIEKIISAIKRKDRPEKDEFDPFTDREKEYFTKEPGKIHEAIYKAASNSRTRAITGAALLTITAAGLAFYLVPNLVNYAQEISNFNKIVDAARNQQIVVYAPMSTTELEAVIDDYLSTDYSGSIDAFREDTNAALDAIQATCQTYQKNYSTPTKEEASIILDSLDDVTSKSIEQLVVYAIQDAYPSYTDIDVDFYYDYETEVDGTDLEEREKKEGFKVSFTDENGNRLETDMANISSPLLADNLGQAIMYLEQSYDTEFETFFEAISSPDATKDDGSHYTYEEISDLSTKYFNTIQQKANNVRPLTVVKAEFIKGKGLSFDLDLEEKQEEIESETTTPTVTKNDGGERED